MLEKSVRYAESDSGNSVRFMLNNPDYTTIYRIKDAIEQQLADVSVNVVDPGLFVLNIHSSGMDAHRLVSKVENIKVVPDSISRIVINEKTGVIVAGADILISPVTVAHGDIKLSIMTDFQTSQPYYSFRTGEGVQTVITPDTSITVKEELINVYNNTRQIKIHDLVLALKKVKATTRDIISILGAIKKSGALQAEIIVE